MSEPSAAAAAAAAAVDASVHKVKTISFKGRRVPIMLQVGALGAAARLHCFPAACARGDAPDSPACAASPRAPLPPRPRFPPQDLNGPCPLLAIANVLLLRNQIQLPAGLGEVSQVRRPRSAVPPPSRRRRAPTAPNRSQRPPPSSPACCGCRQGWWRWWRIGCWTPTAWRASAAQR